jgi:hypothetical protein
MLLRQDTGQVPEAQRKELFRLLVTAQGYGMGVAESRQMAASRFGLDPELVHRIEQEGLEALWAPLQTAPAG